MEANDITTVRMEEPSFEGIKVLKEFGRRKVRSIKFSTVIGRKTKHCEAFVISKWMK